MILRKNRSVLSAKMLDILLRIMMNGEDIPNFKPQRFTDRYLAKGAFHNQYTRKSEA